ncbi:glycosyltransferase [Sphingomonas sp.]|uniref:glycosyltransferase n=1 Tax=Sphingomonas sp. TaxID=28214 RepID=UPI00286D4791|nr:glycosyltransferase [Sphingomonas sp.]
MAADPPAAGRIAILLPSLKIGGAERVALNLAGALKEAGWDVTILLTSHEGELLDLAARDFAVVDLRCDRTRKLPALLSAWMTANPIDILVSNFWKLNLCACLAIRRHRATRLILWEHSPPSLSSNSPTLLYAVSASILYRAAEKVVCVSRGVLKDVKRITVGLSGRLRVVYNAIPAPPRAMRVDPSAGDERIAWIGRLAAPKNPQLLLDAIAFVEPSDELEILFIGDGPLRPALEAQAARMGISGQIRFAGFQADPYPLLASCQLLVVSSDREGLPTVIVEALHCGLDVVSTDCGDGVREILDGGRYGTIVPMADPQSLAMAIESALAAPRERRLQMAGADRFFPATIARQFLAPAGNSP